MLEPFGDRIRIVETEVGGLPSLPTDIALFDTFGGRRYSLARVQAMARDRSIGKVVLYTWDVPPAIPRRHRPTQAIDAVILKSETGEALVAALERVHAGEITGFDDLEDAAPSTTLTQREQEVLALMALGSSNREIAHELYLSVDTVKTHVRTLFQKLGVSNRTQAALTAAEYGSLLRRVRARELTRRFESGSQATAIRQRIAYESPTSTMVMSSTIEPTTNNPRPAGCDAVGQGDVVENPEIGHVGDLDQPVVARARHDDGERRRLRVLDHVGGELAHHQLEVGSEVVAATRTLDEAAYLHTELATARRGRRSRGSRARSVVRRHRCRSCRRDHSPDEVSDETAALAFASPTDTGTS